MQTATLYDGRTAAAHGVAIDYDAGSLRIYRRDVPDPDYVAYAALRLGDRVGDRTTLRHANLPGWRLVLPEPPPPHAFDAIRRASRISRRHALIWGGVASATVTAAAALYIWGGALLVWAAPLVPRSMTEPLGREIVDMIAADDRCEGVEGRAALDRLVARLRPAKGFVEPVTITVVAARQANAFALPGGQVVLLSKLIDEAGSPEEVAGVLAHEFGHVQHRHPNQALIRHFGLSLLLQSLGGNVGGYADLAMVLQRSRAAEREADRYAVEALRRASISTQGAADFFERHARASHATAKDDRIGQMFDTLSTYAGTHPALTDRQIHFRMHDLPGPQQRPALTAADWGALRAMCPKDAVAD